MINWDTLIEWIFVGCMIYDEKEGVQVRILLADFSPGSVYFAVSPRTTLQENVAEQQERRKAEEKELEAQRLLEEVAKEEVVEVLEAVVVEP